MQRLRCLSFRLIFLTLCLLPCLAQAQTTSVTLQVTDAGGQSWNNGTWSTILASPPGAVPAGPPFFQLGTSTPVPNQSQSGALNGTGSATMTLSQNGFISPSNSRWNFTVCGQTTATNNCFTQFVTITSTTTVTLTPPALTVNPGPSAQAYADSEIVGAVVGSIYYNVTSNAQRVCNGPAPCTWQASGGGGATQGNVVTVATSCPGATLNVSCFQVFADVVQTPVTSSVWDVVTTSGGSNVSCGNADCAFTSADVGKFIQATTNCVNPPSSIVIAKTAITSVTDANHISISPATAAATGSTACANYGHDDTTVLRNAWAACTASIGTKPCYLSLPTGVMFFQKALFVDNAHSNRQYTYSITGTGAASILIPTTDFDTTTCLQGNGSFGNASNGTDSYAIFNDNAVGGTVGVAIPNVDILQNFTVDGMGILNSGGNFCGTISQIRTEIYNVHLWNWNYGGSTAAKGIRMVGPSEIHGLLVNDVGQTTCYAQGDNNNTITIEQSYCTGSTGFGLEVTGTAYSHLSFYGPSATNAVIMLHSGQFNSVNDVIQPLPSFGIKVGDVSAATFFCNGSILGTSTDVGTPSIYIYSTSTFVIGPGCKFLHGGAGQLFGGLAGCVVYDAAGGPLQGNPQNFTNSTCSILGDGSIGGIPQVNGNLALGGNWGTSPSVALSGPTVQDTKWEQFTITVGSGSPAANPTITVTFPQKFWNTQVPICRLIQIGGTQAGIAVPFTNGTINNTSAAFTYNGTPTASATIIAQMHCSVSE